MQRFLIFLVLLIVGGIGACALIPERFAVNAPIWHQLTGTGVESPAEALVRERLHGPTGSTVSLFATDLPNVRVLRFTETGDLLASQPREGKIVLLAADGDGDGRSDGTTVLMRDLTAPNGIELRDGYLYVGEGDAVGRVRFDATKRAVEGEYERFIIGIPEGGNHWTRSIRFGPDGGLYVSVGSSCNVCEEEDPRRAALLRYDADGRGEEIFASGLRNSVGFDWQPVTGALYATDNGRDLLGDDFPPCELNRLEKGGFYGWPYASGNNVPDPDFGDGNGARIQSSRVPEFDFGAHNAPLGMNFVRPDAPESLRGAALVALHGSWNRTRKDGYKVVSLHWDEQGKITERDFLTGFEVDEDVIGRPADVIHGPDGAVYVSDDYSGSVYRVALN